MKTSIANASSYKVLFLSVAFLLISTNNFATIRTVSNNNLTPGQYNTIQAAIDASSADDTIYIHPSPNFYAGFTLDRKLTLIGGGFQASGLNPYIDTRIEDNSSYVNNINASGSKIIGIWFNGGGPVGHINFTVFGIHDITITRCRFDLSVVNFITNMYNVTVTENLFFESGLGYNAYNGAGTANNFLISNNVFRHNYNGAGLPFYYWSGVANTIVNNNLFFSGGNFENVGQTNRIAVNTSGLNFSNNIFNRIEFAGLSASTFSNCITNACNGNTPWVENGTDLGNASLGTQNVANTSLNFINQATINSGGYGGVDWFAVNEGSPALSSMAGDPVMGVYGGNSYNYANAGASNLPYIYSVRLQNTTVQQGNAITITVEAKTKN